MVYYDRMWNATDTLAMEFNVSKKRYKWSVSVPDEYYLYPVNDRLYFNNYMNDTIWDITNKSRKTAIILDLKEKIMPQEATFWNMDGNWEKYKKGWAKYDRVHSLEGDSLIVVIQFNYSYEKQQIQVFNKYNKQTTCFETGHFIDDLHGNIEFDTFPLQENRIISFLDFEQLERYLDKVESEEDKVFLTGLLETVKNINSNPVMVVVDLK